MLVLVSTTDYVCMCVCVWIEQEEGVDATPHFGTMAVRRSLWSEAGIRYGATSLGEDYAFMEHALDAGFEHKVLDNSDGCFMYVRHRNTWKADNGLKAALKRFLQPVQQPEWVTAENIEFLSTIRSYMKNQEEDTPVKFHL